MNNKIIAEGELLKRIQKANKKYSKMFLELGEVMATESHVIRETIERKEGRTIADAVFQQQTIAILAGHLAAYYGKEAPKISNVITSRLLELEEEEEEDDSEEEY